MPLERPLLQNINVPNEENGDKDHHFDKSEHSQSTEEDRPGIHKDNLNIEDDEKHRDQVELTEKRSRALRTGSIPLS